MPRPCHHRIPEQREIAEWRRRGNTLAGEHGFDPIAQGRNVGLDKPTMCCIRIDAEACVSTHAFVSCAQADTVSFRYKESDPDNVAAYRVAGSACRIGAGEGLRTMGRCSKSQQRLAVERIAHANALR